MRPVTACGHKGATLQHPGWAGANIGFGSTVRARDRTLVVLDCAKVNSGERTGHDLAIVLGAPPIRNETKAGADHSYQLGFTAFACGLSVCR